MDTLKKLSFALVFAGLTSYAGATQTNNDQMAQETSSASSGSYSIESTDRGGKPAEQWDAAWTALLDWLTGRAE